MWWSRGLGFRDLGFRVVTLFFFLPTQPGAAAAAAAAASSGEKSLTSRLLEGFSRFQVGFRV